MTVPDLSVTAKALLDEGRQSLRPKAADKERIYAALQTRLAASGEQQEVQAPAASLSGAILGRAIVGAIVFLVAAGAIYVLQHPKDSEVAAVAISPRATSSGVVPPPPVAVAAFSTVESEPSEPPVASASVPRTKSPPSDRLGEEAALLLRAEKEFHAGRFASALRLVEEHARKFPSGVLKRERVELRDGVLCGLAAERRAIQTNVQVVGAAVNRKSVTVTPCAL